MKHAFFIIAFLGLLAAVVFSASANDAPQCIEADKANSYKILSDRKILLTGGAAPILVTLKRDCPGLKFHGYFSFTPFNGQMCSGKQAAPDGTFAAPATDIISRAGMPCSIGSLEFVTDNHY